MLRVTYDCICVGECDCVHSYRDYDNDAVVRNEQNKEILVNWLTKGSQILKSGFILNVRSLREV